MRSALLALLLVACKSSANQAPDASVAPDSPSGDAPFDSNACGSCGPITVTLYSYGQSPPGPLVGADVYFIAPDHTYQEILTGSDGKAIATTPDGTEVMVDFKYPNSGRYLDVYPDLHVGDSLVIGDPNQPISTTNGAAIYIDYPTFNDATVYSAVAECTNGRTDTSANPIVVGTFLPCAAYQAAGIVITATDSQGNLGYTSISNIDFSTQNGPNNHVVMPAFQPAGTITTNLTNLPAVSTSDDVKTWFTLGNDPNDHAHFGYTDLSGGSAGTVVTTTANTAVFGDTTHTSATISISGFAGLLYEATASQLLSTVTIDGSTMPHPPIAQSGTYTAATQTVSWMEDATIGQPATIVTAGVHWQTGNAAVSMGWRAPGGAPLTLPTLPSGLSAISYHPNTVVFGGVTMQTFIGKTFHDAELYDTAGAPAWLTGP